MPRNKNWLWAHFQYFVLPALRLFAERRHDSILTPEKLGGVPPLDLPSGGDEWYKPLRQLRAFVRSSGMAGMAFPLDNTARTPDWGVTASWVRLRNALLSVASYAKKLGDKKLLLAGRDVWTLEVLAQRNGIPSVFMPEVSRPVADQPSILLGLLCKAGVKGDELFVDTGFYGTIPLAIGAALGKPVEFALLSQSYAGAPSSRQVFPRMRGARSWALWLEYLPKYWVSGRPDTTNYKRFVSQPLASVSSVIDAAILTTCLWHGADWYAARRYVWSA
jgi:hypothetical protein